MPSVPWVTRLGHCHGNGLFLGRSVAAGGGGVGGRVGGWVSEGVEGVVSYSGYLWLHTRSSSGAGSRPTTGNSSQPTWRP